MRSDRTAWSPAVATSSDSCAATQASISSSSRTHAACSASDAVQIHEGTRGAEEVHAEDTADLESVVQFADLDLEAVKTVLADRESIDVTHEHVLAPPTPRSVRNLSPGSIGPRESRPMLDATIDAIVVMRRRS